MKVLWNCVFITLHI